MRFIKVSLIKFIQEFIVVVDGGISYISLGSFLNKLLFSVLHYELEQATEVVAGHCIATTHVNHHQLYEILIFLEI